jgi:hypothetical protein
VVLAWCGYAHPFLTKGTYMGDKARFEIPPPDAFIEAVESSEEFAQHAAELLERRVLCTRGFKAEMIQTLRRAFRRKGWLVSEWDSVENPFKTYLGIKFPD